MRSAPSSRISLSTNQNRRCNVGQRRRLAITKSYIQMLASPSLGPGDQTSHDRAATIQSGCQIRNCNADFDGWTISFSSDMHESHLGFDHDVVPGS